MLSENQESLTLPDDETLRNLFNSDPATLTDTEFNYMIIALRQNRQQYLAAARAGKKQGPKNPFAGTSDELLTKLGLMQ